MSSSYRPFSVSPRYSGSRSARGSVLVFAVILLVLLFGIGTAFILYVRQEGRASANALQSVQAGQASDAGLNFTLRNIRSAAMLYVFTTPDGYFVPDPAKNYINTDSSAVAGEPQRNLFRMFEAYPTETTAAATIANTNGHAWLWYHNDAGFFASAGLESAAEPLRFTDAKIAHYSTAGGAVKQYFASGPEHAGLARRFVVDLDQGGIAQFYSPKPPTTWKSGQMAEFYVWIADLDGKLFANPKPDGATAKPGWGLDTAFANVGAETDQSAAEGAFKSVRDFGGMSLINDPIVTGTLVPHTSPYTSLSEMWSATGIATPASPSGYAYYNSRYGLDRYFSVFTDDALSGAEAAKNQVTTSVKDFTTALNVNTANYETLRAVLSRVPLVDGYDPSGAMVAENLAKAEALAARICAKRPFLGRMDFEDFLAAHVNSKSPATSADVDDMLTATTSPCGMLYLAMDKRDLSAITPVVFLDLDQYGVDNTQFLASHSEYSTSMGTPVLMAAFMKQRYAFFRTDDGVAKLFTDATNNALLTSKALNNLLNAVSGKRRDTTYGYSFYSFDNVNIPFGGTATGTPKFEYNELLQVDITAGVKTYLVTRTAPDDSKGTLKAWHPTTGSGYYEMTFLNSDDTQEVEYGFTDGGHMAGDQVFFVHGNTKIVTSNAGFLETPNWAPDQTDGNDIYDFADALGDVTCHSTVHGPVRAYRNVEGTGFDDTTLKPTPDRNSGPAANGDVSWTPRFAFRSRYFAVYVLSRALDPSGQPYAGSTRRVEAVYDALKDQVIWHRQPVTEKRNLGDPEP